MKAQHKHFISYYLQVDTKNNTSRPQLFAPSTFRHVSDTVESHQLGIIYMPPHVQAADHRSIKTVRDAEAAEDIVMQDAHRAAVSAHKLTGRMTTQVRLRFHRRLCDC